MMNGESTKEIDSKLNFGKTGNGFGEKKEGGKEERGKDPSNNVIFIGGKPLVNYIRAVMMQFTKWNAREVTIKSRGKFISKAVDVAEVSKRSMEGRSSIKDIKIASESFETDGKKTNISTMDIVLSLD